MVGTMRGPGVLAILVLACIAASRPALVASFGLDGRPRPAGLPDLPTESYGPLPLALEDGVPVTCEWYGFAHILYPTKGAECLLVTRELLANTTLFPPGYLTPFAYYWLKYYRFDAATNSSYCKYGCFDMRSTTGPVASPPSGSPTSPPPVTLPPPPPVSALPPVSMPTPPPPSVLVSPPPVVASSPPPPPVSRPPPSTTTPPDSATTPPAAVVPPPPGGPTVVNLNRAGFLQPTGLVSFIISGALLLLNGLVGF